MRALLIEFDLRSGKRAGDVNPKDPMLPCRGWQNLDCKPALEIRIVTDDRDLTAYSNVDGITILDGKDAINAAIDANIPKRYSIFDMALFIESAKENGIKISSFSGLSPKDLAERGHKLGLAGIRDWSPEHLEG